MIPRHASESRPVYLDYHATTPVDPRVAEVVRHALLEAFGNANSREHQYGDEAAALVDGARSHVAVLVGAETEQVQFTSGSSDAIRRAIFHAAMRAGSRPLQVVASSVEHRAVLDVLASLHVAGRAHVRKAPVDERAQLDLDALGDLARGADLVCVMAANNEVGTVYPVEEVARIARDAGAAVLVDATQAAGRLDLQVNAWGVTYLSLSAHKIYGPKGVGALVIGGLEMPEDEHGTPNVPGIAGLGEACRLRCAERAEDEPRIAAMRDRLESLLAEHVPGLVVNGDRENRLSGNLHVSARGIPNDAVLARLHRSVALSTGAACTSGSPEPSHVLRAMGLHAELQEGALRIGLGKFTTLQEVELAAERIAEAIGSVRAALAHRC